MQLLTVDYGDQLAMEKLLQAHEIDTVVSCLNPPFQEVFDVETRLVRAASDAGVRRFVPSQYCLDYEKDDE